jgi:hypothetical protein
MDKPDEVEFVTDWDLIVVTRIRDWAQARIDEIHSQCEEGGEDA